MLFKRDIDGVTAAKTQPAFEKESSDTSTSISLESFGRTPKVDTSLIVSGLALLVSVAGVVYQQTQTRQSVIQNELAIHTLLIQRNADLLEAFVDYPDLRPLFYDNEGLPEDDLARRRAMTLAEMWTDLFEQVVIQLDNLPADMAPTWKQYAIDMHASSPAIREYFRQSCGWYVEELRQLWGEGNSSC